MNKPDFCHHPTSERCNPKSVRFILSSCRRYSLKEPSRFEAIADLHFGGVSNDARLQSIGNSRFPDHRITGPSGFSDFLPLPPASGPIFSWLMVILHRSRLLVGALTLQWSQRRVLRVGASSSTPYQTGISHCVLRQRHAQCGRELGVSLPFISVSGRGG